MTTNTKTDTSSDCMKYATKSPAPKRPSQKNKVFPRRPSKLFIHHLISLLNCQNNLLINHLCQGLFQLSHNMLILQQPEPQYMVDQEAAFIGGSMRGTSPAMALHTEAIPITPPLSMTCNGVFPKKGSSRRATRISRLAFGTLP